MLVFNWYIYCIAYYSDPSFPHSTLSLVVVVKQANGESSSLSSIRRWAVAMRDLMSCILDLHVSYLRGLPKSTKSSSLLAQLAITDLLKVNLDLGAVSTSPDATTVQVDFQRLPSLATSKRHCVCCRSKQKQPLLEEIDGGVLEVWAKFIWVEVCHG